MDELVLVALAVSLVANAVLAYCFYRKKHVLTVDARALLHEFTSGRAIIDIKVLDTTGIFYRSPRG